MWREKKRIERDKKKRLDAPSVSKTLFNPKLYLFRDYWSNRCELNRNQRKEGIGWKNNGEKFDITNLVEFNQELNIIKKQGNHIDVFNQISKQSFAALIDPINLIKQFEPQEIVTEDVLGFYRLSLRGYDRTGTSHFRGKDSFENRIFFPSEDTHRWEEQDPTPPDDVYSKKMTDSKTHFPVAHLIFFVYLFWVVRILGSFLYEGVLNSFFSFFNVDTTTLLYMDDFYLIGAAIICGYAIIWILLHETTKKVKEASAYIQMYNGRKPDAHFQHSFDVPFWLNPKIYWVFDYIYVWNGELTKKKHFPFIYFKNDLERIELWIDAKTGDLEWIVSDYHYRELWYKADKNQTNVNVFVLPNFHTIVPLNITHEQDDLMDFFDNSVLFDKWSKLKQDRQIEHDINWIKSEMIDNSKVPLVPERLGVLWWDYMRYPLGTDNKDYLVYKDLPVSGLQPVTLKKVMPHYNSGKTSFQCKKYDEAINHYKNALELYPKHHPSLNELANVFYELKDYEQAISYYKKVLQIYPHYYFSLQGLGNVFYKLKDYEQAISYFKKVLEINPRHYFALHELGNVFYELKDYEQAISYYKKVLEIYPRYSFSLQGLGNVFYVLEDFKKAISYYKKALEISPEFADVWYYLCQAYKKIGNVGEEKKCIKKAEELGFNVKN